MGVSSSEEEREKARIRRIVDDHRRQEARPSKGVWRKRTLALALALVVLILLAALALFSGKSTVRTSQTPTWPDAHSAT